MKKSIIFFSVAALVACTDAKTDTKTEHAFDLASAKAEIISGNQQFEQACANGDSAAMVAVYHVDAKSYPPGIDPTNREWMGSSTISFPQMGFKKMSLSIMEVFGGPHEVIEIGTWERSDSMKPVDKGKYFRIWKKDGDHWKIYRDIYGIPRAASTS